jgi:hypothetical protein
MPLSLSDDEYNAVQAAAAPIHPLQRGAFLKALAEELERHPVVGPGAVHRCAAELQKRLGVEAHTEVAAEPQRIRPRPRPAKPDPGLQARRQAFAAVGVFGFVQCSARSTTIGERNMTTVFIEARPKAGGKGPLSWTMSSRNKGIASSSHSRPRQRPSLGEE